MATLIKAKYTRVLAVAAIVCAAVLLLAVPQAEAKTIPDGQTVKTSFLYMLDKNGERVLVADLPIQQMANDFDTFAATEGPCTIDGVEYEITGDIYNISLLDRFVTPVHQEARGFTVEEFVHYAKSRSDWAGLNNTELTFAGDDQIAFWEMDGGSFDSLDTYTWNDLYGVARYNYPALYANWDYAANHYKGATAEEQAASIDAIWGSRVDTPVVLSVYAYSQRYMVSDLWETGNYNMENYFNGKELLDTERTIRLMKPMTEAELRNQTSTANDSRYWISYVLLEMAETPDLEAEGAVAAPTATVTDGDVAAAAGQTYGDNNTPYEAGYYYVDFACATEGATIYYNHNFGSSSYMPTALYTPGQPVKIDKSKYASGGVVTVNFLAVKDGYTDAGIQTISKPYLAPTVGLTELAYVLGVDDVTAKIDASVMPAAAGTDFSAWRNGLTVTVGNTSVSDWQLTASTVSSEKDIYYLTVGKAYFPTAGTYKITLSSPDFATRYLAETKVLTPAPTVTVAPVKFGQPVVLSFADDKYQADVTVRVQTAGTTAWSAISSSYLDRSQAGQIIIKDTYYSANGSKFTAPGAYNFRITNNNYAPAAQEVSGTLLAATLKGDIDGNSKVENSDLILLARYLVSLEQFSSGQLLAADFNQSGGIDNGDVIILARFLVGLN